uniref:Carrier domain-containing protein n=1 Tax=Rhabditophanes sp. KR3021 TaxID=114890 RepID=A0AC35TM63_9BILA
MKPQLENSGSQERLHKIRNAYASAPLRRSETIREDVSAEVVEALSQALQHVSTNENTGLPFNEEPMEVDETEITLQIGYILLVEDLKDDLKENAVRIIESYEDGDAIDYQN